MSAPQPAQGEAPGAAVEEPPRPETMYEKTKKVMNEVLWVIVTPIFILGLPLYIRNRL
jgi:hypothetical protein